MRLNGAIVALPAIALAQVITVTEYPDFCKATYTTAVTYTATSSGSRISTVVQSTVTVVPTPFTDASINEGTPFAIEIQPAAYSKNKRQAQGARTFLDIDGYLTSDASEAVQYVINDGQIGIRGGQGQVTANETDLSIPFAASTILKPIRTTFFSETLQLGWNNSAFEGGAAELFQVREANSTRIVVYLNGVRDPSWTAVDFALRPTSNLVESLTVASAPSATGTISILPITSTAASASATPSGNVDPSGACGVGTNDNNCFGARSGSCCSQYGFCGTGPDYCGVGCQTGFGICDPVSGSDVATSSWVQVPTTIAGSSTWTSILVTASSTPVQPPTYGAPSVSASSGSAVLPSAYSSPSAVVPPTYGSSTSVVSLPGLSSTVASSISPVVTSSSADTAPTYSFSSVVLPPPGYSSPVASPEVSTSISLSYSASDGVTLTSTSLIPVTSTLAISTQQTYSGPVGTPIVPSQYPTIAPEEPSATESFVTPSFTFMETGTSLPPIYSSLASSYASSMASEASSWSSAISSASSSINAAPSYEAPSSAPFTLISSFSSAVPSTSSMLSSISSAGLPPVYSAPSSVLSSISSVSSSAASSVVSSASSAASSASSAASSASSAASSASSVAGAPPGYTVPASTTRLTTTTTTSSVSITSSGAAPAGTGVGRCPDDNGLTATDSNGVQYVVGCSADFRGQDLSFRRVTDPYTSCYTICDEIPNCGGFIWQGIEGSSNGFGTGNCYFKAFTGQGNFVPGSNTLVAAVRPQYLSGYTSPTSAVAPPAYTPGAEVTPTPAASTPVESPSQATSCAATAVPNPQFYASETASRASSWLVLPTPTPCDFGDPDGWPIDDSYCNIDIPQGLQLYSGRFTTAFASTNGIIAFNEGTSQFQNQRLPTSDIPTFALTPFWDDTAMFGNQTERQGVYYQNDTTGVTFEFYLSRPYVDELVFHYTVSYSYATPGVFVYSYFTVDSVNNDNGIFATVGMQGADTNNAVQSYNFSYKTRSIYPGLVVTCNSNTNICTSCTQQI